MSEKLISMLFLIAMTSCGTKYYKPTVMPSGVSELKRKQIKRDFTN